MLATFAAGGAFAAPAPAHAPAPASARMPAPRKQQLADELSGIRTRVLDLEQGLIDGVKAQNAARANVKKIQQLLKLQREERELGRKRMAELEGTVKELEERRKTLRDKIKAQQASIYRFLKTIDAGQAVEIETNEGAFKLPETERLDAPRRRVLANLVDRGLKEVTGLQIDLSDAQNLETRIEDEKAQLASLFQDLNEQEGVLELNRQLQVDLLKKSHDERLAQLENYRHLKSSQAQVEQLLSDFNARKELEHVTETERVASKAMNQGVFAQLKGKLPLPIDAGRLVSSFGRVFDSKSGLHIFKKGVDIAAGKSVPVRAISAGKIAYSGELPDYGRVTIVDHGNHFYSLCAHLGELSGKAGDPVAAGDRIGTSDESGTPVYFEIRARNVAVNPVEWIAIRSN
jgi:septal ring factor EnvC (AmiA/AmiB activator)